MRHLPATWKRRRSAIHQRHVRRRCPFSARDSQASGCSPQSPGSKPQRHRRNGWRAALLSRLGVPAAPGHQIVGLMIFSMLLTACAASDRTILAGGDLARGETFACDVTVCGAVPRGTALPPLWRARRARDLCFRCSWAVPLSGSETGKRQSTEAAPQSGTPSCLRPISAGKTARYRGNRYQRRACRWIWSGFASHPESRRKSCSRRGFQAPAPNRRCTAAKSTNCCFLSGAAPGFRRSLKDSTDAHRSCGRWAAGEVRLEGKTVTVRGLRPLCSRGNGRPTQVNLKGR